MSASNLELVRHILTETAFIIQHTDKKTKEQVIEDEVLCRAVVRSIEIIVSIIDKQTKTLINVHGSNKCHSMELKV